MGKYDSYVNAEGVRISKATGKPLKKYNKVNKAYWAAREGKTVVGVQQPIAETDPLIEELKSYYNEEELKGIIGLKKDAPPVELVHIAPKTKTSLDDGNTGFLIASDWHADEVVKASTVLGKNEYDKYIAEKRITNFFANAAYMIKKKPVDNLVIGLLGDMIGGYIHPELEQTNSMSPMRGVNFVKSLIISGLKYLHDQLPKVNKITVIGICGNHSRTTKRMQFNNGFEMSFEYFLYKDIEQTLTLMGLTKFEFIIPESEFAYLDIYGRKILMCHGHQVKSAGGVGGLFPPMLRWFGKLNQTVKVDKVFLGHFHQSIYAKEFCVNGSLKGYDAFAMGHGLAYEEPQQTYVILNEKRGFIFYSPIFAD
jgi:predicted phosphodiesterase